MSAPEVVPPDDVAKTERPDLARAHPELGAVPPFSGMPGTAEDRRVADRCDVEDAGR